MTKDKNNFQKWVFSKTKIMTHNDIFPPNNGATMTTNQQLLTDVACAIKVKGEKMAIDKNNQDTNTYFKDGDGRTRLCISLNDMSSRRAYRPGDELYIFGPPAEPPAQKLNVCGGEVFRVPIPDKPMENKMIEDKSSLNTNLSFKADSGKIWLNITKANKMTTKLELAEEIKALQEQLDAMPEVGINFKPKMGGIYFIIHPDGEIDLTTWSDDKYDQARYARGNCYPTREAAERIDRNRQTLVKLREFAFVPDFTNDNQDKYHFYIDDEELEPTISDCYNYGEPVCFATDELRIAAREAVGEAAIVDMLEGGLV